MNHKNTFKTRCSVPAKLILTGEYSVLYNGLAVGMAIDLPTTCQCTFQASKFSNITIELKDFQQAYTLDFSEWHQLATQIETRFQQFKDGSAKIQSVLKQPVDLILTILYQFEKLYLLTNGQWHFSITSKAPIGCGLGSSAAVILSVISNLTTQLAIPLRKTELLNLALSIESYRHGCSSGIDPATLIQGGLVKYRKNQVIQTLSSPLLNAWLIDTGLPESTTGECIEFVKNSQQPIETWQNFNRLSQIICLALQANNAVYLKSGLQDNHQALVKLGVVPKKVQTFIKYLQDRHNAAAKICGAGSIKGVHAGMVICLSEQEPTALCEQYGYRCTKIHLCAHAIQCKVL